MKYGLVLSAVAGFAASTLFLLGGCEATGSHQVSSGPENHAMACKLCYDEAKTVVTAHGKGAQWSRSQVIRKHMCPGCNAEVVTYTEEGKPMIKCPKCAPEGVACDKCTPPKTPS